MTKPWTTEGAFGKAMTDTELANAYRNRITEAYQPVAAILNEAMVAGLEISFQAGPGPDGKNAVQAVKIMRVLK